MSLKNRQYLSDESEDENDEDNRTLFCANVDERVCEDLLYEVFLQAGPIESVRIPKDHNGRQRTFGFITYVHACAVQYAMQLFQGLTLYRKTIFIKFKGSTNPSPNRNNTSPGYNQKRISYDNSSLRGPNILPYNDNIPSNPFKISNPLQSSLNSMMPPQHASISKHSSTQRNSQTNASPYRRNNSSNIDRHHERERDRDREHDRRRHCNNGSNRNSDQRSGGKNRR